MSTRAMYTFRDGHGEYHVYKHHDGYPSGAIEAILNALLFAWTPPRFEADEFAAAFVAGNKEIHVTDLLKQVLAKLPEKDRLFEDHKLTFTESDPLKVSSYIRGDSVGGGVRLMPSGKWQDVAPGDIEYRYEITYRSGVGVMVRGFHDLSDDAEPLFVLPLSQFEGWTRKQLADWEDTIRGEDE